MGPARAPAAAWGEPFRGAPRQGWSRRDQPRTRMKPRFAAKVAPRHRRKAGTLTELGQAAARMRAGGATQVAAAATRVRAEQTKRPGRFRGREEFARRRREEEIPD